MRIGLIIAGLLIFTMSLRIMSEILRDDPDASDSEHCTPTVCIEHTTPRCSPDQQSASVTLIIRARDTTAHPRLILTVVDTTSGKEVERHIDQKIPASGVYRWIFDATKTPKTGTITAHEESVAYTLDPNLPACLIAIR